MRLTLRDWITIVAGLVAVELAIGNGTVSLTNAVPDVWIPTVKAWCGLLAFCGSTIITVLSRYVPPGEAPAVPPVAKVLAFLAVLAGGLLVVAPSAHAQRARGVIENIARRNDVNAPGRNSEIPPLKPDDLIDKLQKLNLPDFQYALAKATAANNNVTKGCWQAWVDLLSKAQAPILGPDGKPMAKPDPHVFSDIEDASELLQALQTGGAIQVGCSALADATKKSVAQIIAAVVTGGGLSGLLPLSPVLAPIP